MYYLELYLTIGFILGPLAWTAWNLVWRVYTNEWNYYLRFPVVFVDLFIYIFVWPYGLFFVIRGWKKMYQGKYNYARTLI